MTSGRPEAPVNAVAPEARAACQIRYTGDSDPVRFEAALRAHLDAHGLGKVAIERAGIKAPSRCRSGECGWCRSKLISGEVYCPAENEGRRHSDIVNGYIHPCSAFAFSDIVLEVPGEFY